ncbi:MAG: hypothetical protein JWR67_1249 [Mucilaginibacter sp.]|nr:hypothetical protein [Mucilaginibacter sp.]
MNNIIKYKQVQLEKVKNFTILHQSEEIAQIGSWEYNLNINKFIWSSGMYNLFNLEKGTKVKPEIYLQYATSQSQFAANRVVNYLKTGITAFEETLEILAGDDIKTIKIKAAVIHNLEGQPVSVIGVDMDISAQKKLKEEKEQLESMFKKMQSNQKKRIFQSILLTQEEERKRIAESLHNSLGQLLYGIKLNLEQLNFDNQKIDIEGSKKIKKTTERLITEAIKESRRLSHELTPVILEELGLKEAIHDICRQFSNSLIIKCQFSGQYQKTSKLVEIVIYRTIQELITNIIKHAQATESIVKIHIDEKSVNLTVQDNGIGFIDCETNMGIGLKTIKSKVKLLNGKFNSISKPGKFTIVSISIPNTQE